MLKPKMRLWLLMVTWIARMLLVMRGLNGHALKEEKVPIGWLSVRNSYNPLKLRLAYQALKEIEDANDDQGQTMEEFKRAFEENEENIETGPKSFYENILTSDENSAIEKMMDEGRVDDREREDQEMEDHFEDLKSSKNETFESKHVWQEDSGFSTIFFIFRIFFCKGFKCKIHFSHYNSILPLFK